MVSELQKLINSGNYTLLHTPHLAVQSKVSKTTVTIVYGRSNCLPDYRNGGDCSLLCIRYECGEKRYLSSAGDILKPGAERQKRRTSPT